MKAKDLKTKKPAELMKLTYEKREELRAIRSNLGGSKARNVKEISALRKDIARMLTELNTRKD